MCVDVCSLLKIEALAEAVLICPSPKPILGLVFVTVVMMAEKTARHSCPNTACSVLGYINNCTGKYTFLSVTGNGM